jgi:hypothetical protein
LIFYLSILDWFQAGKGPNPDVLSLDNDMDAYFKAKAAKAEEASEEPAAAMSE